MAGKSQKYTILRRSIEPSLERSKTSTKRIGDDHHPTRPHRDPGKHCETLGEVCWPGLTCVLCPKTDVGSKKRDVIDVSWITDFDGTVYKLQSGSPEEPDNRALLCMSIQLAGFEDINSASSGFLQQTCYAPYLRDTEAGDGTREFSATFLANVEEMDAGQHGVSFLASRSFSPAINAPSPTQNNSRTIGPVSSATSSDSP